MAQQKKGFIARMLEGKERSEEYARSTLPTNRWQLFFDIFKGNFGKIVKVNLLTLLFCVPMIAVIIFSNLFSQVNGQLYPFGSNLGGGYPAYPNIDGMAEMITLQSGLVTYGAIALTAFIAAVGLAGGMYVVRNMVWTEGVFVTNDFWRGVKLNYKNALQTALFFTLVLFVATSLVNLADFSMAVNLDMSKFERVWLTISKVVSYIVVVLAAMMSFWMISLGVNYTQGFFRLLKNSILIVFGTLPQTVFFGALALLPFVLFFFNGQLFTVIGIIVMFLFGFAYALLVWLDFSQWVFDKYLNPKIEGAKVGRGIYSKNGEEEVDQSAAEMEYQRALIALGKSQLSARPMKPIDDGLEVYELPTS
ncbi:MAG: hypothetical protein IJY38_03485, partial [Clostridia bacterium]|nr:hypothetical protein [Clostridia bacterium]